MVDPLPSRRDVVLSILRPAALLATMLVAYVVAPVNGDVALVSVVVTALVGLAIFSAVFVHQVRRIRRSRMPTLTAVEALVLVYGTFLLQFAVLYVAMSASDAASFEEPLNRVAGLYLSITVLSTVGFGDISPVTDLARTVVSFQMLADLVLIATAVRVLTGVARKVSAPE